MNRRMRSEDSTLGVDGARLRYRDEGQGPPVILIHGWTLDLEMWGSQAAALSADFRIIRLDRRGFGLSTGNPSIEADCEDVAKLCGHLGLERVALLGVSQGARVVMQFAAAHPELICCMILDGPPHLGTPGGNVTSHDVPYAYYRTLAQSRGLEAFRREWSAHALTRLRTTDPAAKALLTLMLERYPGKDLMDTETRPAAAAPAQAPLWPSCPVLVINGEFELESRKGFAKWLQAQHRQVDTVEIPAAGHLCNLDNPQAYNAALRRFLEQHAIHSSHSSLRSLP